MTYIPGPPSTNLGSFDLALSRRLDASDSDFRPRIFFPQCVSPTYGPRCFPPTCQVVPIGFKCGVMKELCIAKSHGYTYVMWVDSDLAGLLVSQYSYH